MLIRVKGFWKARSIYKYFYENLVESENIESIFRLTMEIITMNCNGFGAPYNMFFLLMYLFICCVSKIKYIILIRHNEQRYEPSDKKNVYSKQNCTNTTQQYCCLFHRTTRLVITQRKGDRFCVRWWQFYEKGKTWCDQTFSLNCDWSLGITLVVVGHL